MLIVHAVLPIRADKRDEFLAAAASLVEASNAEDGVLEYRLTESATTPGEFTMIERYVDDAAFTAHLSSPHFGAAGQHLAGWLSGPPQVTKYPAQEGEAVALGG